MSNDSRIGSFVFGASGHTQINHEGKSKSHSLMVRKLSRSAEELEAETVSYLICKKMSIERRSAEYFVGYITGERDLLDFSYETVIRTADKIENLFCK